MADATGLLYLRWHGIHTLMNSGVPELDAKNYYGVLAKLSGTLDHSES
jgi:hypothetical protein